MSGLFGKAMRFARSKQGKQAIAKAQAYVKSPEGREKLEDLKDRVTSRDEPKKKPAAKPAPKPEPAATEPRPDPDAPA